MENFRILLKNWLWYFDIRITNNNFLNVVKLFLKFNLNKLKIDSYDCTTITLKAFEFKCYNSIRLFERLNFGIYCLKI